MLVTDDFPTSKIAVHWLDSSVDCLVKSLCLQSFDYVFLTIYIDLWIWDFNISYFAKLKENKALQNFVTSQKKKRFWQFTASYKYKILTLYLLRAFQTNQSSSKLRNLRTTRKNLTIYSNLWIRDFDASSFAKLKELKHFKTS